MANIYNLSETLTNLIGGNIKLTLEPDSGYGLPSLSDIVVTGGSIVSYDDTTGELVVTPGTTNVDIEYSIPVVAYLTFSSPNSFTLNTYDNTKHWDGTLEYSTNTSTWNTWDGTTTLSSGSDNKLYLRGTGNTIISVGDSSGSGRFVLTGSNISCEGNIENLLDYQTVKLGNHPTMEVACYQRMFKNCTALISAPELPATTLARGCYLEMFNGCSNLTAAPALPATTLTTSCYAGMFNNCTSLTTVPALPATTLPPNTMIGEGCYFAMFYGCTSLIVSDTATSTATHAWRIPGSGTFTTTSSQEMTFTNCAGTRSTDDMRGQIGQSYTYYTQNEPVN